MRTWIRKRSSFSPLRHTPTLLNVRSDYICTHAVGLKGPQLGRGTFGRRPEFFKLMSRTAICLKASSLLQVVRPDHLSLVLNGRA